MFRILVTPLAKQQIKAAARWWRKNRPAAPLLFEQELTEVRDGLMATPTMGAPVALDPSLDVRRLLLRQTRYHLYYSVDAQRSLIYLRAVWHASRGSGPWIR